MVIDWFTNSQCGVALVSNHNRLRIMPDCLDRSACLCSVQFDLVHIQNDNFKLHLICCSYSSRRRLCKPVFQSSRALGKPFLNQVLEEIVADYQYLDVLVRRPFLIETELFVYGGKHRLFYHIWTWRFVLWLLLINTADLVHWNDPRQRAVASCHLIKVFLIVSEPNIAFFWV